MFAYSSVQKQVAFAPLVKADATSGIVSVLSVDGDFKSFGIPDSLETAATMSNYEFVASDEKKNIADGEEEEEEDTSKKSVGFNKVQTNHGDPKKVLSPFAVTGLSFDRSGEYLTILTDASMMFTYNVASGSLIAYMPVPRRPTLVVYSPDNRFIIFADRLGDVYAVNVENLLKSGESTEAHLLFGMGVVVTTLAFATVEGKTFIICGDQESKIRVSHYPNFFEIQSMCMGQTSIISAMAVATTSAGSPVLFSASTNPPVNSSESEDGSAIPCIVNPTQTKLSTWDILTGTRLASAIREITSSSTTDSDDVKLTYFSSSLTVADGSIVLLAPASVSCERITSATSYVKSSVPAGADISSLIAAKAENCTPVSITVVNANRLTGRTIVSIGSCGENKVICALDNNTLALLDVTISETKDAITLTVNDVKTVPQISGFEETPYPDFMVNVHARLIETFYKHEFFFANNNDRKKERALKKLKKGNQPIETEDDVDME